MRLQWGVLTTALFSWPAIVQAGPCDAHYRFEGNLQDSGGQGYHGQMIGEDGVPATPQFEESPNGIALRLDGTAAMRATLDISPDLCPQMTVVAWITVEPLPSQAIFSDNGGSHLRASGSVFKLRNAGRDVSSSQVIRPNMGWMFVAATWDNAAHTHRLHWNARHAEASFAGREPKAGDPAIWVGAMNDRLHFPAKDVLIDEIRFIGRSLTVDQVNELRAAGPGGQFNVTTSPAGTGPSAGSSSAASGGAGAACATHGECTAGTYCAVDGTCHPDDHLPMPVSSDSGMTLAERREQIAEQYGDIGGDVESNSLPDLTPPESGRTVEDMRQATAERYGDIGGDVESNSLPDLTPPESGDESTDSESTSSSAPADDVGGTLDGKGSASVGDYLAQVPMPTASSGDTLECKSPVQRLSDLATGFRDKVVEIAHSVACGMAERPVASLAVAAGVEDPSVYETRDFQSRVFNEVIEACRTATPDIVYLPDTMLAFWNEQIANNNWSTIGPRSLVFGSPESGNIISPGDRMFISTSPWIDEVDPHVTIEEFSGRARMQVTICSTDALTGRSAVMRRFVINDTRDERQDEKETFLHIISARLSYITVFLDGRSTPDRHFRYKLIVDK